MNNITLRQIRYVDALARHGHYRRAAEACAISQPALSMQVKELEEGLGIALFERGLRQLRLTAYGEQFVQRARAILEAVDELAALARAAKGTLRGTLRLGLIPTLAPYLLPALIGDLRQSHPELDIQLRETVTTRILEELEAGRLDVAIVALPVSAPALVELPLFSEDFVLVRPEEQRAAPVPDQEGLAKMRLLLLEEGHCLRDQALAFCTRAPRPGQETLDGSSLSTLVQMVAAGLGVTLIPEIAVPVETRSAPVAVQHFPAPAPQRQIGMVWRRSNPLGPSFEAMAPTIRAAAQRCRVHVHAQDQGQGRGQEQPDPAQPAI